ncbi:MAG: hypothetical protein Q8L48_36865 [Archangium sp.]|nr:hypothetical protein [Archangium sp.]
MKHVVDVYCDVGPGLLLDQQYRASWTHRTFDQVVLDQAFLEDALRGECTYLKDEAARQFSGKVEVLIGEPTPDLVKYAVRQATGLRLELPTGRLRLLGVCSLLKDGAVKPGAQEFLSVDLTPGRYLVDVYGFIEQAARLEDEKLLRPDEAPLAGELPPGPWTGRLQWLTLALAVLSVATTLFACLFWLFTPAYVATCLVLAVLWVVRFVAYRTTGERERERHNTRVWKEHLARLPELPDYVVVLRPDESDGEPPEGGGLL